MVLSCCSTASCYCSLIAVPLYSHDESHLSILYDIHSSPCVQMVQVQVLMRTLSAVSKYRNVISICFAMKLNLYNVNKKQCSYIFVHSGNQVVPSGCKHTHLIISERISRHQFELKACNNKSLQCKLWWSS